MDLILSQKGTIIELNLAEAAHIIALITALCDEFDDIPDRKKLVLIAKKMNDQVKHQIKEEMDKL